ncbi:MAG: response regulator [Moorellaceae bacterium]
MLIVDDSSAVRAYHATILQTDGFEVEVADNGYEGLEKFLTADYDLLLVDVNMPRMHGYELIREVRRSPRGKKVGIIVISTEAGPRDRLEAFKAGADLYLIKPIDPQELSCICRMATRGAKGEGVHDREK